MFSRFMVWGFMLVVGGSGLRVVCLGLLRVFEVRGVGLGFKWGIMFCFREKLERGALQRLH